MADETSSWNVDTEVNLFHAMRGHKPVGVNRHFQMMCIHEKLNNSVNGKISATNIWEHLGEMYDLQALNESEILPFPNKEIEFSLPENEYENFMNQEFPRSTEANINSKSSGSQKDKDSVQKESRGGKASKGSVTSTPQSEDSPKPREQRKRTRGQVSNETPPSTKRSRRT